jgi:hypothetical protein
MKKILALFSFLSVMVVLCAFGLKGNVKKIARITSDSILTDRKHYVDELRLAIKGKEDLPADSVFKNIKMLKGVPAGRLISIMDRGYANSLGVTCGYCHENEHWDLETKPTKEITREMAKMNGIINNQLLKNINGLSANPIVNCTTCHRGSTKPALNMPMPAGNN